MILTRAQLIRHRLLYGKPDGGVTGLWDNDLLQRQIRRLRVNSCPTHLRPRIEWHIR
jgi:hypothetical protein